MSAKLWAGLDVGVYQTSVCVTDDGGGTILETTLATDPAAIVGALTAYPEVASIALESGVGNYLVRALHKAGLPMVMYDAFKASRFLAIRRRKTDRNDARGLADLARLGGKSVSVVHLRGDECRSIRYKLHLRAGIVKQRVAAENLLRSLLREHGKTVQKPSTIAAFRAAIRSIRSNPTIDATSRKTVKDLVPLLDFCENVRNYNKVLDRDLARVAQANETCRRLMTIPGIGPICALSFFSTIEDPWRFRRIADVGAYLGLVPIVRETGGRSGRARISKAGDKMTRTNLYNASKVIVRRGSNDCDLKSWAIGIKDRLGYKRAMVALSRKLALVMTAVWKSGGEFIAFGQQLPREASPGTP